MPCGKRLTPDGRSTTSSGTPKERLQTRLSDSGSVRLMRLTELTDECSRDTAIRSRLYSGGTSA